MDAINDVGVFKLNDGFEVRDSSCFPFPFPEGSKGNRERKPPGKRMAAKDEEVPLRCMRVS